MGIETGGDQESVASQARKMADLASEHGSQGRFDDAVACIEKIEVMKNEAMKDESGLSGDQQDEIIKIWHEASEGVLQSFALKLRMGISIEGRF